ncbi:translation elongation factor Ts [Gilvimarinus agarilyticus]|uniref:Elongation factor Ts n=1 Tax=Reichenbachiella agariperforans TaxID=156994 RepID=A0A1M6LWB2_REIAG|nr:MULTISPECIES: translation elongation factor Ts [Reichenbachiella]MBU2885546.1 translation elongation factor Ts [Gilvimarinus agarilyticus]MBU2914074.1 translation elongation factor Ts [Reichenbachiella agariperforans]RJE74022.1 translation elongation factor Ts [Reichenbachiella sp. MSK19-1]SHJ75456.1 elongation factor Ts [Reichenbachiella agariperforans]
MAITAQEVNKLRQMTGAGMMDCKKALVEAEGDFDTAIELLRKKGQKVSASRADRETNEGVVFVKTNADHTTGVVVAFSCETDFVAKNEEFMKLGNDLATAAFENKPADAAGLKALKSGDDTFGDRIIDMIGKIGEKMDIIAYEVMEGEAIVPYVHAGSKLGVLVSLKNTGGKDVTEAGKDVAMQIAAMNPVAVDKDGVDSTVVEKEIEIGKDQARQEGKPEEMLEKIALGKLNKFYKENTLLPQAFVKDNKQSIAQYLDGVSKGLTVVDFKRISIG